MSRAPALSARGVTHPGLTRGKNEDCFLADAALGLYLVLDGMGGHSGGEVAAARARDVIHLEMRARLGQEAPAAALEAALGAASAAVHGEAQRDRGLHGMGTTAVACCVSGERAVVAHVGDSRAYLLRRGRMRLLTRDHTVVAELVARGALAASEAAVHPYKSVLSRNLGGRRTAKVDVSELELEPGDRLLLCSDGLSGYASHEAMEQVLAGAEDADRAADELVELALRGGGGDNVTAVVIELGLDPARDSTLELRRGAAVAWWSRRERFEAEARERGVHESPICAVLSPDEAVAIVAGNLCEAIYHDLDQAAGLHVWTYAENLANGWLDQGGAYEVLRDLLDRLRAAAIAVVAEVGEGGPAEAELAVALETDLLRALIVAEMAVAGALGERMRKVEQLLVRRDTRATTATPFDEGKTVELSGAYKVEPPSPMVAACLERGWKAARGEAATGEAERGAAAAVGSAEAAGAGAIDRPSAPQWTEVLDLAHRAALDPSSDIDLAPAVRLLFGTRVLGEGALRPLLESLDRARTRHLDAVRDLAEAPSIRAAALHRLAGIHEGLMSSLALMVVESTVELTERYQRATTVTARLRAELARHETHISKLEREVADLRAGEAELATVSDGAPVGGPALAGSATAPDLDEDPDADLTAETVMDAPAVGPREPEPARPKGGKR
ncbi:MAG TPA: protein phosphatase 2C domain-containing protein [Kofleriaceae bacterium]|nr:protein phosphatase 2C domain-containing protein [Kofleriaceae bacterium]